MPYGNEENSAAGAIPRRLFHYNLGFFRQPRLRRILSLAGHDLCLGLPKSDDGVVVWGQSPVAARGEWVARKSRTPLIRLEDAFLRSVRPGRMGDQPLGLIIDPVGVHFDGRYPSLTEQILTEQALDDPNILARAASGIQRLKALDLSKYNNHDETLPPPQPGYVLVADQTLGDASLRCCGAGKAQFRAMLVKACAENPGSRIVIKTHPETQQNLRPGHFSPADAQGRVSLMTSAVSPWQLLAGATAVYTVSSQLGFEAILAGHRPRIFGQPFYAGWGASDDETDFPRRTRERSAEQLFAAAMILAPTWYDPCRDRLCRFEDAVDQLEAETRAFREDRRGYVAYGMRMWKRGRLQAVFGQQHPIRFSDNAGDALTEARNRNRDLMVWAGKKHPGCGRFDGKIRSVEDGFLRSKGLGAELVPPLSLVSDDLGIYYDPTRESRLERLLTMPIGNAEVLRAFQLREKLVGARLTKYNLKGRMLPELGSGRRILVPGQVEDDASIRLGAGTVRSNLALVEATRAANPDAVLIYKPHPDVEAGLRPGHIDPATLRRLVDHIAEKANPVDLIDIADEVWTMTSLLGFEALLRGRQVTCLGSPFYAGWGLTRDLGPVVQRRQAAAHKPTLEHLIHSTLIAYPRYFDPISRRPCPVEVAVERLSSAELTTQTPALRILAKIQGRFASHAGLWR